MIRVEGRLPTLALSIRKVVDHTRACSVAFTRNTSARVWRSSRTSLPVTPSLSPVEIRADTNVSRATAQPLVPGLTWADTVDLDRIEG